MLGTDKELIELKLANDWKSAKNTVIDRLIRTFGQHPNHFFTEHDIHSVLYSIAREELQLNGVLTAKTSDRYEVALVHHEYPTPFRCDMRNYGFRRAGDEERTPKGGFYRRGHYDLVILNPEFVENTEVEVVYGKDYQRFASAMHNVTVEPLIWACEVVFFPVVKTLPKNALKIIEQDTLKVKETLRHPVGRTVHFCKMGSVLVFTSHSAEETLELKRQVAKLSQKHKLEVALATAVPGES